MIFFNITLAWRIRLISINDHESNALTNKTIQSIGTLDKPLLNFHDILTRFIATIPTALPKYWLNINGVPTTKVIVTELRSHNIITTSTSIHDLTVIKCCQSGAQSWGTTPRLRPILCDPNCSHYMQLPAYLDLNRCANDQGNRFPRLTTWLS